MRKKNYEGVVIINAALDDDQIENTISRIQETITSNGGEISAIERWGRKRLAYTIRKSKSGYYLVLRFVSPVALISTLERMYRLDETIIRYLTIALDKRALEHIQTQIENASSASEGNSNIETNSNDVPKINEEKNN